MKKIFTLMITFLAMTFPLATSAIDIGGKYLEGARKESGYDQASNTTFASNLGMVVNIVLSFSGVIFMMLMVYAGYLWMTARGDSAQIDKAQNMIRSAIIGLIITVGAYSITRFIVPQIVAQVSA